MSVKKQQSVYFNFFALIIVLGHMLVPHQHHTDSAEHYCETESKVQLFGALADFFHPDLGEEHLEEWTKEVSPDNLFFLPSQTHTLESILRSREISTSHASGFKSLIASDFWLRGPPVVV